MKIIPYFGGFIKDADHGLNASMFAIEAGEILVDTLEPYSDIVGFSDGESGDTKSGVETAQDRLQFFVKTLPALTEAIDELTPKVDEIKLEIDKIDHKKYPKSIFGFAVREKVETLKNVAGLAAQLFKDGKPLIEAAPYLLGVDDTRRYVVLFQNDKELRPTGGFVTAYTIAEVRTGNFTPILSADIYELDDKYTPKIRASDPLIKYIRGPYLISKDYRLRDMNWSPDFKVSMDLFSEEAKSAGINEIDGIIAVDTQVLVNILDVLGPIEVPEYGDFSAEIIEECKCPQVVYELESFADVEGPVVWSENEPGKIVFAPENYGNRKGIIGPLMNSILANMLGQSNKKIPELFEAGMSSLLEKHILVYAFDDNTQKALEDFGIAGRIEDYDGDYLHINDANLGGRKSNLYVAQEVAQEVEIADDGTVIKHVTITYNNPQKYDGWLNSVLPNWVRIYVPKGSELIDLSGLEDLEDTYEEFGKTVYAGFFELRPLGVSKVNLSYKLPFKVDDEYKILVQKQPGTDSPLHSISLGKKSVEMFLKTDKEFKFEI